MCAEFLNAEIMICMFEVSVKKVCDLINNLEGDDLKDKVNIQLKKFLFQIYWYF